MHENSWHNIWSPRDPPKWEGKTSWHNVCGCLSLKMYMVWYGPCCIAEVFDLVKIDMISMDVCKCT